MQNPAIVEIMDKNTVRFAFVAALRIGDEAFVQFALESPAGEIARELLVMNANNIITILDTDQPNLVAMAGFARSWQDTAEQTLDRVIRIQIGPNWERQWIVEKLLPYIEAVTLIERETPIDISSFTTLDWHDIRPGDQVWDTGSSQLLVIVCVNREHDLVGLNNDYLFDKREAMQRLLITGTRGLDHQISATLLRKIEEFTPELY